MSAVEIETVEVPVRWLEDLAVTANTRSRDVAYRRIYDRPVAEASPMGLAEATEQRTAADWRRAIDELTHEVLP